MKAINVLMAAFFLLAGANLYAQNNSKVIAVVTKADWCTVCQANGERAMTEVFSKYKEPQVLLSFNDITDDAKKATSKEALEKLGIYDVFKNDKLTGQVTFIDTKTKKVVGKVSLAKPTEEIKAAFDKAIKKS